MIWHYANLVNGKLLDDEGHNLLGGNITFASAQQAETYVQAHELRITIR